MVKDFKWPPPNFSKVQQIITSVLHSEAIRPPSSHYSSAQPSKVLTRSVCVITHSDIANYGEEGNIQDRESSPELRKDVADVVTTTERPEDGAGA